MDNIKKKTKILLTTSMKGGVGKSTIAANVALRLALQGQKTLLCDMDFGVRSLDLIMGVEDSMIFNLCDCITGKVAYNRAVLCDPKCPDLCFFGAPYKYDGDISPELFAERIRQIAEENNFDYVILDTPGGNTHTFDMALAASDGALIVTSHHPAAVRGATRSADIMDEHGVYTRLIINCFDPESVLSGRREGILELIDSTGVPLIGVVPYDSTLAYAQEKGILAYGDRFISGKAFANIAARLISEETCGRKIPILKGVKCPKRKKLLTK